MTRRTQIKYGGTNDWKIELSERRDRNSVYFRLNCNVLYVDNIVLYLFNSFIINCDENHSYNIADKPVAHLVVDPQHHDLKYSI